MPAPIIRVENLGKKYRIQHRDGGVRYRALRDLLADGIKSAVRLLTCRRSDKRTSHEEFWALKDINVEIREGEVVGIIGRNGAGKSTLLKILSRITEPTAGRVTLNGRVASLLEVGTGFHPELTGRENIYLNGAILGMRRAEIGRKFDEIVGFAEVDQFLDTPVKRYSSGMYMRLAFAIAAHLEPEILVVDEVLAVGDAEFQKKCLGKMGEVAKGGRTVLFVSHNMNAVERLCSRALLLTQGRVAENSSDVHRITKQYLNAGAGGQNISSWLNVGNHLDHPSFQPLRFDIVDGKGRPVSAPVGNDEQLLVRIRADIRQPTSDLNFGFALYNGDSEVLLWTLTTDGPEDEWPKLELGVAEFHCALPARFLNEGSYRLELIVSHHFREWIVQPGFNSPSIHFEIQGGLSDSPYWMQARPGILAPYLKWNRDN